MSGLSVCSGFGGVIPDVWRSRSCISSLNTHRTIEWTVAGGACVKVKKVCVQAIQWTAVTEIFVITVRGLEPVTCCDRGQGARTVIAYGRTGSLNLPKFMLQQFIRFSEFTEFLFHSGKLPYTCMADFSNSTYSAKITLCLKKLDCVDSLWVWRIFVSTSAIRWLKNPNFSKFFDLTSVLSKWSSSSVH